MKHKLYMTTLLYNNVIDCRYDFGQKLHFITGFIGSTRLLSVILAFGLLFVTNIGNVVKRLFVLLFGSDKIFTKLLLACYNATHLRIPNFQLDTALPNN